VRETCPDCDHDFHSTPDPVGGGELSRSVVVAACPECGSLAERDTESGAWCCTGGHSWTQPLAATITLVPEAERDREAGLKRAAEGALKRAWDEIPHGRESDHLLHEEVHDLVAERDRLREARERATALLDQARELEMTAPSGGDFEAYGLHGEGNYIDLVDQARSALNTETDDGD
jgi:hypothetical protein